MTQKNTKSWTVVERQPIKIFNRRYRLIKRFLDLILCGLVLPFFIPVALIIIVLIRLDSAGPAMFVQERVGKGGRVFRIYKFRTLAHKLDDSFHRSFMKNFVQGQVEHGEGGNTVFKPFTKAQVTRVGKILRTTSLDELPQIINVLRDEMSFVGPRPNVLWEVQEYHDWHKERLEVLPGITGLAQVRGRSGIFFDEIVYWDIEYIRHQSLLLDLKILWWTVASMLLGKGGA